MRDINVVAEKKARNGLKIANSLGCAFHFESEFNLLFFQPPKENKGRRGGSGVPEPAYCGRCDQHFNNPRYLLLHYKGGLISEKYF